jgi:hypothetical protein
MSGQLHALAALSQRKAPSIHWIGSWVGPRAALDAVENRKATNAQYLKRDIVSEMLRSNLILYSHFSLALPSELFLWTSAEIPLNDTEHTGGQKKSWTKLNMKTNWVE